MPLTRRELLARTGLVGLGVMLTGSCSSLFSGPEGSIPGYGPLLEDPNGLLDLPRGFTYKVLSREAEPTSVPGQTVMGAFDGMAAFPAGDSTLLVRNHEQSRRGTLWGAIDPEFVYDAGARGGTTTLRVDRNLDVVDQYVSLAGTTRNCAGGRTPWNTWLTCEESEARAGGSRGYAKAHGFVFEVDPVTMDNNRFPQPLTGLGRFRHEAAVVDPDSGTVYLTEDSRRPFGLLYRFVPDRDYPRRYGGLRDLPGRLQALWVPGLLDLSAVTEVGTRTTDVRWVDVPDPLAAEESTRRQFNYAAYERGNGDMASPKTDGQDVTRGEKLEGAWWNDDSFYFVSSFARTQDGAFAQHKGQVWRLDPRRGELSLELIFATDEQTFDGPDNITISPYGGGVVLAENGDGDNYLVGADSAGRVFPIARNRKARTIEPDDQPSATPDPDPDPDPDSDDEVTEPESDFSELAGVTFSDDGQVLFANVLSPGVTFAITGPWQQ